MDDQYRYSWDAKLPTPPQSVGTQIVRLFVKGGMDAAISKLPPNDRLIQYGYQYLKDRHVTLVVYEERWNPPGSWAMILERDESRGRQTDLSSPGPASLPVTEKG